MARRIESHSIPGPAGTLESLLEEPEDREPRACAVVCHPHPLYGGTLHNKVVYRLARGLRRAGFVVLRFNFRGVGRSEGVHAGGEGEIDDARACLEWLRSRYPGLPYSLAGFSFGSRVILQLGCAAASSGDFPRQLIAAGFPTRYGSWSYLGTCPVPKLFIQSLHDEHGPQHELEVMFQGFSEPKELVWVEAGDHFFSGGLESLEKTVYAAALGI